MRFFEPVRPGSPEGRTAAYYLTVFTTAGATATYLGIWLSGKGLSAGEIGWINSVPVFLLLMFNIWIGRLADRAKDWRSVIIAGSFLSGILPAALFFVHGFWEILVVWTLVALPFGLVTPVIDAAAMRMTRRNGSNFAVIRAFGTIGYMLALAGTGLAVGLFGSVVFVPLLLGFAVARAGVALILPRFRAPETRVPMGGAAVAASRLGAVMHLWFVFPILAFALVQGTHFILQAFGALVWLHNGISEVWIGPLLALGAASEVAAMFLFKRFAGGIAARHLILIAMVVSTIRWTFMAFNPPLWALALLQLTHGITFGFGYLGMMNFIANWTSEDVAAEAQSFATVVQLAVIVITGSVFGYLVQFWGAKAFLGAAGYSILGAILVLWSLRRMTAREA